MAPNDTQLQFGWLLIISLFALYPVVVVLAFGISVKLPGIIARLVRRRYRSGGWSDESVNLLYGALLASSVGLLVWTGIGAPLSWLMPPAAFLLYLVRLIRGWD